MFKMGRRKTIEKVAKRVNIKCPKCSSVFRFDVPEDGSPQFFDCPKCNQRTNTPITKCCIICAFSDKKCSRSSIMNAAAKGLELRR